ncbi:MAG: protease modulator HflC [Calditrichaeota bacterium]|nr:MAG: protease modulator HflC [Calditrichota bacterium]
MKVTTVAILILAILLLIVAASALYTVDETEQCIITQFGEPVGQPIKEAGLHVKMPFVQKVTFFPKQLLEWDGDPNQIPTADKKYIWVNTFARWRISDPLKFYQSVNNEINAQSRLDDILDGVTRDLVTQSNLIEVVRNSNRKMMAMGESEEDAEEVIDVAKVEKGRSEITRLILEKAREIVPQYGIELIDVEIKHINYIEDVRKKVYERMISERKRIAEKYRSEGQGERAKIEGTRKKELQRIESEAYRKAQEIMGEADAKAAKIYADAYNRDPEFYSFIQTLESYRKTLNQNSVLFLRTDSDFLKYLRKVSGK